MFCNKCGNQIEGNATFCNKCGNQMNPVVPSAPAMNAPFPPYAPQAYAAAPNSSAGTGSSAASKMICVAACIVVIVCFFALPFFSVSAGANFFGKSFDSGALSTSSAPELLENSDEYIFFWAVPVMAVIVLVCVIIKNNKTRAILSVMFSLTGLASLLFMTFAIKDALSLGGDLGNAIDGALGGVFGGALDGFANASTSVTMQSGFWGCLAGYIIMLISPIFARGDK